MNCEILPSIDKI